MSMRLKDKVCIVTGGGSGIGRATALLFAREGARLAIADKRKDAAQAVSQECARHGVAAIAIEMDVAKAADARRMVDETIKAFGRLDVLVNNAGYGIAGSVVETDEQAWDDLMSVNVRGVFLCAKFAIPAMKANGGGVIVNTASVVAAVGIRNRAAYCASKGAVAALTRAIAMDHVGRRHQVQRSGARHHRHTLLFRDPGQESRCGSDPPWAGAAAIDGTARHAGRDCRRHPVSRERREPFRHRFHPDARRRLDRAIARQHIAASMALDGPAGKH